MATPSASWYRLEAPGEGHFKFEGSIEKIDGYYVLHLGCETRVAKDFSDVLKKIKEELKESGMFDKEKK